MIGVIVSVAVWVLLPKVAEIVDEVVVATPKVVTVKVADVAPAGTVTLDGTLALPLLDDREIVVPPVGA